MERDPAMVWDYSPTVVRTDPPSRSSSAVRREASPTEPAPDVMTLRRASSRYGVSVATLQSWCRKGLVSAVKDQGRWLASGSDIARRVSLLADRAEAPPEATTSTPAGSSPAAATPEETLLVPRDAWDKMLSQLGNLHEAGQQLAEARERAAKAETEAAFLRERLAELRTGNTTSTPQPAARPEPEEAASPDDAHGLSGWIDRARSLVRRRR